MIHHSWQIAWLFVGAAFLGALAATLYQFVGRYFIGYRVRPRSIEVVLLRTIPVWRIAHGNIAGVREVRFKSFRDFFNPTDFRRYLFALRLGNRLFGRGVLIELKAGVFRAVLITPDDPSAFITALRGLTKRSVPHESSKETGTGNAGQDASTQTSGK